MKGIQYIVAVATAIILSANTGVAQEESEVTAEELKLYAWMEDTVMYFKEVQTELYTTAIKENELLKGVYNDVKNAYPDSLKMAEMGITVEQVAAYEELQAMYEKIVTDIKDLKVQLIKEEVGVSVYNKIRSELKSNAELRQELKDLMAEMKSMREEESEEIESTSDSER